VLLPVAASEKLGTGAENLTSISWRVM